MASTNNNTNVPTGVTANESVISEASTIPQMQFVDRMWKLPVIQSAWSCSQFTYTKVKESNNLVNWALSTAEQTFQKALEQAAPIAVPMLNNLETPIHMVDQTLCKGLDTVESYVPQVTEPPSKIMEDAKNKVQQSIQPTLDRHIEQMAAAKEMSIQKANSLKELSWSKANEVLATQYGNMAVNGIDNTAALANRLIDYYFPPVEGEEDNTPISPEQDRALHTLQTIGLLSNKVARRVYRHVSSHVRTLKTEDIKEYVASLLAILQLTRYLRKEDEVPKKENGSTTEDKPKN